MYFKIMNPNTCDEDGEGLAEKDPAGWPPHNLQPQHLKCERKER
jgi:hypothetical protein